jgi:hypothetical protein
VDHRSGRAARKTYAWSIDGPADGSVAGVANSGASLAPGELPSHPQRRLTAFTGRRLEAAAFFAGARRDGATTTFPAAFTAASSVG